MRRIMAGSEDNPVSKAKTWLLKSSKQSSKRSKPDLEPKRLNQGVQIWAGTKNPVGDSSKRISNRLRASRPKMGLPSLAILPMVASLRLTAFASAKLGTNKRL